MIVGERVNASVEKDARFARSGKLGQLIALAKEQEREGAHVAWMLTSIRRTRRRADMTELVSRLVTNVKIPLMLDSTEWKRWKPD